MLHNNSRLRTWLVILACAGFSACTTVKAYQKSKINDSEMELSARRSQQFEQNFQLYREGGSGANGGKSGGGCGCN
ncbi:hypothetical protein DCC81_09945 [Chitinophaga parva]|uniref:DUF4266 domain-containing protein n=1 Tax=Chitinophaga parva TaxID=2169414 RepID=A0A2T7BPY3_9BACT|nr:DUF4266 domain-containing protein [Chitinophaga parva]PUZ29738.1 hypothetical protein DCC81_09945 [Chitinophaga parva]